MPLLKSITRNNNYQHPPLDLQHKSRLLIILGLFFSDVLPLFIDVNHLRKPIKDSKGSLVINSNIREIQHFLKIPDTFIAWAALITANSSFLFTTSMSFWRHQSTICLYLYCHYHVCNVRSEKKAHNGMESEFCYRYQKKVTCSYRLWQFNLYFHF